MVIFATEVADLVMVKSGGLHAFHQAIELCALGIVLRHRTKPFFT
jgi:hypothetical protein